MLRKSKNNYPFRSIGKKKNRKQKVQKKVEKKDDVNSMSLCEKDNKCRHSCANIVKRSKRSKVWKITNYIKAVELNARMRERKTKVI